MIDVESSRTNDAGLIAIADSDIEAVYELEVYTISNYMSLPTISGAAFYVSNSAVRVRAHVAYR